MRKYLIYTVLLVAFASCKKQELKLPRLHTQAVNQVYNNSAVWIFFTLKGNDTIAKLNQSNRIETTNWLFNIDRRLTLKQVSKPLNKLLEKRQKKSPHHIDGLKNYFSFSDSIDKKIKFLPFKLKQIIYRFPNKNDTLNLNFKFYKNHFNLKNKPLLYSKLDSVISKSVINNLNNKQIKFYYHDALSYEKYVKIKAIIYQLPFKKQLQTTLDYYFK